MPGERALVPLALALCLASSVGGQTAELLRQFDNEHDLAAKERLLLSVTRNHRDAAPELLRLAKATDHTDTRWMAMRGMAALGCVACADFLVDSLRHPEVFVRANAARALSDLRIRTASGALLAMFAAEKEPPALEQGSLALRVLQVRAGAPLLRQKIPECPGPTRAWLIQALGSLGTRGIDVPFVAPYLEETTTEIAATEAIQDLTGVSFGVRQIGLISYPTPQTLAARAWWRAHKDAWPRCDDCRSK